MRPEPPARTPGRPSGAAQTRRARLPPAPPTATPTAPGGSEPPNPGPAWGAPSHPGCARDPADEEWRAGRPAALPCRSDAASARHSKRRMSGPELRFSEVSPGLRLRPQSRFSRFGSRAFKEPSARPRPGHPPRASPRDEPRPRPRLPAPLPLVPSGVTPARRPSGCSAAAVGDSSPSAPGEVRPRSASVSTKRPPGSRGCPRPGSAGLFCPLSPLPSLMLSEAAPGRWENAGTLLGPVLQGPSSPHAGAGCSAREPGSHTFATPSKETRQT